MCRFKLDSLMKNISMVFQSVYLFADTLRTISSLGAQTPPMSRWLRGGRRRLLYMTLFLPLPDGYDL